VLPPRRLPSGEIPTPSEQMSLAAVMLISMTLRLLLILVPVWVVFRVGTLPGLDPFLRMTTLQRCCSESSMRQMEAPCSLIFW